MQKKLHFEKSGRGKEVVILFHGFGQTSSAFQNLIPVLERDFLVYSFDLYYHGKSIRQDAHLSPHEWKTDFKRFLTEENIGKFSIIAFSLGGRFALATAVHFPDMLSKLTLIAPDGIYKNFWFLFSTSKIGNPVFRYMMCHPKKFYHLLNIFEKWRLTSPSMISFVRKELSDGENCLRVYRSWTYFRKLQLHPGKIARAVNAHEMEVHVILGEKDHIVPIREILPKLKYIEKLQSHLLPLKHHQLVDGSKELILSILKAEKKTS